jgi:hypothetical protein
MPETSVDEDHGPELWHHYVGFTVDALGMKAIPEAQSMQCQTKREFWLGVLATYPGHHAGPRLTIDLVCHMHPGIGSLTWYTAIGRTSRG